MDNRTRRMAGRKPTAAFKDESPEPEIKGFLDFFTTLGLVAVLLTLNFIVKFLGFAFKTGYPVSMIVMGVLYYNSEQHCPAGGFSFYLIVEGIALLCKGNLATAVGLVCNVWNTIVVIWIYSRVTYDPLAHDFCDRTLYLYTLWASMFWWAMIIFTFVIVVVFKIDPDENNDEDEEETGADCSGGPTFVLVFLSGCQGRGQDHGLTKSQKKRNRRNRNRNKEFPALGQ